LTSDSQTLSEDSTTQMGFPLSTTHQDAISSNNSSNSTQESCADQKTQGVDWDYDLFVIGAGSGGVRASRKAAEQGMRVAVAEASDLGGTCVNLGCVPKKLFVYASEFPELAHLAKGFGVDMTVEAVQWQRLKDNKNTEIARLNGIYQNLLDNAGVDLIRGKASLVDPHSVEVNGKIYRAKTLLLAVGGKPFRPSIPGIEYTWTSDDMFHLDSLPKRLLVVGSGYIAVEFAGIMNGLGVNTWLAYRAEQILRGFDDDIRAFCRSRNRKERR
jgi:glutathione reductase (NADPH)